MKPIVSPQVEKNAVVQVYSTNCVRKGGGWGRGGGGGVSNEGDNERFWTFFLAFFWHLFLGGVSHEGDSERWPR
jgi:hypothetical protein